jgi:hypothetical protein
MTGHSSKRRLHPEADLQRAVVQYLAVALPPEAWFTAINPRPLKDARTAAFSKALGMKAGCPDLLLVYKGRALFIELKAGRGYVTGAQEFMHAQLRVAGAEVAVCRDIGEVCHALNRWGIPTRARVAAE